MFLRSLTSALLVCGLLCTEVATAERKKTYIVNLVSSGDEPSGGLVRRQNVQAELAIAPATVLYNYGTVLDGFAATLTDEEVQNLNAHPDVQSVVEDSIYHPHTTRTPSFLGITDSNELLGKRTAEYASMPFEKRQVNTAESNIIIGVLDTGAWPENPSYSDAGLPEIPAHWKGSCEEGDRWTKANCNKKLIGAAYFYKGYVAAVQANTGEPFDWASSEDIKSARDTEGHGTHTSTTAAGSLSPNASLYGEASGTAQGMAKDARLAIYKICWSGGCFESDIVAAMERAIADGVNVLSGSFGGAPGFGQGTDGRLTFAAMKHGVFTSFSAGNSGPDPVSVTNVAPWVLTVAASTLDRDFPATLSLGNGKSYSGVSLYTDESEPDNKPLSSETVLPLILGSAAALSNATAAAVCDTDSLDPSLVAGKIVVCIRGVNARTAKGAVVKKAGGRGMVLLNTPTDGEGIVADLHVLPALHLSAKNGEAVLEYANSSTATASLKFEGTRLGVPAPQIASFSSRGPSGPLTQILKPDITGPGVDILAGWSGAASPASVVDDPRRSNYTVISGTSMSCPHLSGIAAYIMARRPEWSIAAVRSAIMTTAYTTTKGTQSPMLDQATSAPASPFDYGNGHVDPVAALNPGLIYNVTTSDYQEFVCAVNTTRAFMSSATGTNFRCDKNKTYTPYNLNYPSFSAVYKVDSPNGTSTAIFPRTVTNVGGAGTYKVSVSVDDETDVKVAVIPEQLTFKAAGETQPFEVVVTMKAKARADYDLFTATHGRLEWSDGTHRVASSLAFIWD